MITLQALILLATTVPSSTYGYGELMCGDPGHARKCDRGAITASGEVFDPELPTAAISMPRNMRMKALDVWMQVGDGPCVKIRLNDKMNHRYIGVRGFDLSPKALDLLIGKRSKHWKGKVTLCQD